MSILQTPTQLAGQPTFSTHRSKPEIRAKILHLINGEHFSGAERVQDLLALNLPKFGYEVGFACVKPNQFPQVRQSQDTPLFATPMLSKFDFRCVEKVVSVINQSDYAAIHAHTPRTLLIGRLAASRIGCPLIYHVHSPVGRDSNRPWANRINTWMERWSLKKADQLICVSNSLGNYMKTFVANSNRISVVPNGVTPIENLPDRNPPREPWVIGTMALFRPRKGTEVLLDALHLLQQRNIPVQLNAVGPFETESYQAEIMQRVESLGIGPLINWAGFQKDINAELRRMDLFVLPSLYGEGLPMVVLEAMANGVPVVASRVEGIPEAVRDQQDGLIFEPGDAQDLADRLQQLIGDQNRWQSMSTSAYTRQRQVLSDTSMARGVARVYDRLL